MHFGSGNSLGTKAGEETHALTVAEIPQHSHAAQGTSSAADSVNPLTDLHATAAGGRRAVTPYVAANNLVAMKNTQNTGASQGHNNMQPYLAIGFVIALQGLFPSRN